jgi:hypothetical protein
VYNRNRQPRKPSLSAFVSQRSWLLFSLIERDAQEWLQKDPEDWPNDVNFNYCSAVANSMLVVNDCAERSIKSITDYIRSTRDVDGRLDDLVLVGEDRRSLIPNLSRENLLNA